MVREYTSNSGRKILSPVLPFRCSLVSEGSRVSLTREGPLAGVRGCPMNALLNPD